MPFSLIYLAYGVPLGVINYFTSRGMTSFVQALTDQMKAQSTGHEADLHLAARDGRAHRGDV